MALSFSLQCLITGYFILQVTRVAQTIAEPLGVKTAVLSVKDKVEPVAQGVHIVFTTASTLSQVVWKMVSGLSSHLLFSESLTSLFFFSFALRLTTRRCRAIVKCWCWTNLTAFLVWCFRQEKRWRQQNIHPRLTPPDSQLMTAWRRRHYGCSRLCRQLAFANQKSDPSAPTYFVSGLKSERFGDCGSADRWRLSLVQPPRKF